jgi:hypothetical protein
MVEDRNENLQNADGMNEQAEAQNNSAENQQEKPEKEVAENLDNQESETHEILEEKSVEEVVDEIEKNVATESEDEEVIHDKDDSGTHIPLLSYKDFDLDNLIEEAQKLLSEYPVQKIKKHLEEIKNVFEDKVDQMKAQFKTEHPDDDATLEIPQIKEFNYIWKDYKSKLYAFRKEIQEKLETNLIKRKDLIEELKKLIDSTEYTFEERLKKFKDIQKSWRSAGNIPRAQYSDIWQTYKHHEERFYDLLDLDRDYRDKVFEENLNEKKQIIDQARELLEQDDIHKIFKELQMLHKKWKEETGPVAREFREKIWEEFKTVTKQIHDKRRDFYKKLKEEFAENLVKKRDLIEKLKEITADIPENHKDWQDKIKEVEQLRETFYKIGFVPKKNREEIWDSFKSTIKEFNKHKNNFYKSLKELQKENLDKKMELIKIAEDLKDSDDWETVTPKFKEIQEQWKQIGHVPRKYSEKIWQQFRTACNHYFDRYYAHIRSEKSEEFNNFMKKKEFLTKLKEEFKEIDENKNYTIDDIQNLISKWKELGYVPANKHYINVKFNKFINTLYDKLKIDKRELSFIKFKNIVDSYYEDENYRKLDSEKRFVRQKIESIEKEIEQLENNMLFIKSDDDNNPFKREAERKVAKNKEILAFWKKKQQYLDSLDY